MNEMTTDIDEARGELIGGKVKNVADAAVAPMAAYGAMQSSLPTWARVGFGVVAVVKAPGFLRRVKRYLGRT